VSVGADTTCPTPEEVLVRTVLRVKMFAQSPSESLFPDAKPLSLQVLTHNLNWYANCLSMGRPG